MCSPSASGCAIAFQTSSLRDGRPAISGAKPICTYGPAVWDAVSRHDNSAALTVLGCFIAVAPAFSHVFEIGLQRAASDQIKAISQQIHGPAVGHIEAPGHGFHGFLAGHRLHDRTARYQ